MKTITNKGNKILHVGSLMLLPEESHELPKEYENNPVLDFLCKARHRLHHRGRTTAGGCKG